MTGEYYFRRPCIVDCATLSKVMRPEDRRECWDCGAPPFQALASAVTEAYGSTYVLVHVSSPAEGVIEEKMLGMFGAKADVDGADGIPIGTGTVWSLWTDFLTAQDKLFIWRVFRDWLKRSMREAGIVAAHNVVSEDNAMARKWIEKSGCFAPLDTGDFTVLNGRKYLRFRTVEGLV